MTLGRSHSPSLSSKYQSLMSNSTETDMAKVAAVREWTIEEYVYTCSYSLWVYYCIVTMDEEVSKIWPKIRKAGSILYILIKYPLLIYIALDLLRDWRFHLTLSLHTCHQLGAAMNLFNWVASVSTEVAMLLCLYALLGAERKYLYAFGIIFMPMFITSIIMSHIIQASAHTSELSDLEIKLGYACPLTIWGSHPLYKVWSWMSLARTSLGALLVIVTLITRYRNQKGILITVIRRDGILYFVVAFVLHFFAVFLNLPGVQLEDQYGVIDGIYGSIVPICAIRLLFNIRKGDDDGVPHAASAILFSGQRFTIQSDRENATQDAANGSVELETVVKQSQVPGPTNTT